MDAADQVHRAFHMRRGTMRLSLRSRRGTEARRRSVRNGYSRPRRRPVLAQYFKQSVASSPSSFVSTSHSRFLCRCSLPTEYALRGWSMSAAGGGGRSVTLIVLFNQTQRKYSRTDIAFTESLSYCVNVAASCAAVTCLTGSQCIKGQCVSNDDPSFEPESQPGGQRNIDQQPGRPVT